VEHADNLDVFGALKIENQIQKASQSLGPQPGHAHNVGIARRTKRRSAAYAGQSPLDGQRKPLGNIIRVQGAEVVDRVFDVGAGRSSKPDRKRRH
jgi:hypothetical protein